MRSAEVIKSYPDFEAWSKGDKDFNIMDYAFCTMTVEAFCAVANILEPDLVLHEEQYFLEHRFDLDAFHQWKSRLSEVREIQKAMNHVHIASLFQNQRVSDETAVFIADEICRHWNRAFESKDLVAKRLGESFEDAQVTLFRA